jgi:glutathione synthase/RimK-type ligase-like ATP-grasp enzyme
LSQRRRIAIVSAEDDLHTVVIQKELLRRSDVACDIVQSDRIAGSAALTWSNAEDRYAARVPTAAGEKLPVHDIDVIWWRRVGYPQQLPAYVTDPAHVDLINNDCRVALAGLLLNEFRGTWINHPIASQVAGNKLVQLQAARRAGLRVPRTLVSQDPSMIRRFCDELHGRVVVKAVSGTSQAPLLTRMLTAEHLASEDTVALCPAIYQEYIPGNCHLRVQCFGEACHAVVISTDDLDWRANLAVPIEVTKISAPLKKRLQTVLRALGLRMGIVDLKVNPGGEVVWLEINPQGQFLFVEGLTGLALTSVFADFLYREADVARKRKRRRTPRARQP